MTEAHNIRIYLFSGVTKFLYLARYFFQGQCGTENVIRCFLDLAPF